MALTRQQKEEAQAAVFGLPSQSMSQLLTTEQIQQMREILAQVDGQAGQQINKEFDLNNPPPDPNYRFTQWPRLIYNDDKLVHRSVANQQELEHYLAQGWTKDPIPETDYNPESTKRHVPKVLNPPKHHPLATAVQVHAAAAGESAERRRGPGRPPRAETNEP